MLLGAEFGVGVGGEEGERGRWVGWVLGGCEHNLPDLFVTVLSAGENCCCLRELFERWQCIREF